MEYRKKIKWGCFLFCLLAVNIFLIPSVMAERIMAVSVKQSQVRATPSYLGKILARLAYGDKVSILAEKGGWLKVKSVTAPSLVGWTNASALANPKVVLKAGTKTAESGAATGEVALAGKGFNAAIEKDYAKNNSALDYTWVDRMEKITPAPEAVEKFLVGGNLSVGEGE